MSSLQNNHTCNICLTEYYACNDCDKKNNYMVWRTICCCELHFQIYYIVNDYTAGFLTKEQAYDFLMRLNLTNEDISVLRDSVKSVVLSILQKADPKAEQTIKPKKK